VVVHAGGGGEGVVDGWPTTPKNYFFEIFCKVVFSIVLGTRGHGFKPLPLLLNFWAIFGSF
jgi:hypothetical protein